MMHVDNPWYGSHGEIHRRRFLIVRAVEREWPDKAAWVVIVLDRAFYQAFQYTDPDALAEHLEQVLADALNYRGSDALHMAGQLMREKAMALGIPERDW